MNILVDRAVTGEGVADWLYGQEEMRFSGVRGLPKFDILGSPRAATPFRQALSAAYLPVILNVDWESAIAEAKPWIGEDPEDWVTFIPTFDDRGLVLPQDSTEVPY